LKINHLIKKFSVAIFDSWYEKLKEVRDDALTNRSYCDVHVGVYSSKFAQATELAAYYKPNWTHKKRSQNMFVSLIYSVLKMGGASNWGITCITGYLQLFNLKFLLIPNFWIEWKQNKIFTWISGIMSIGIFAD
jgi:hypothetical protein